MGVGDGEVGEGVGTWGGDEMSYQEFEPPLLPEDPQYVPPGKHLTAHDGTVEGDCPAVCESLSYACTLDEGHGGRHIAHGSEIVDGLFVIMYAEWDDEDTGEETEE